MNNYLFKLLLIIFLINTASLEAKVAPENHKQASFKLSVSAKKMIDNYQTKELLSAQKFIQVMKNILDSQLTEKEKVDAFIILLDKIKFLFDGTVTLAKDKDYFFSYTKKISRNLKTPM